MINKRPMTFIACKGGKILVNKKGFTGISDTPVQYGDFSLSGIISYYIPVTRLSLVSVHVENTICEAADIFKLYSIFKEELDTIKDKTEREIYVRFMQKLNSLAVWTAKRLLHYLPDEKKIFSVKVSARGEFEECVDEFDIDPSQVDERGFPKMYRKMEVFKLPVCEGSQWCYTERRVDSENLNAILSITETPEEALELMKKTNFIKDGVWLTPEEFIKSVNFKENSDKRSVLATKAITDAIPEIGRFLELAKEFKE